MAQDNEVPSPDSDTSPELRPSPKPSIFTELIKLPTRVEFKKSPIHGHGVFAIQSIKMGTIVFSEGPACCYMSVTETSIAYAIACLTDKQRDAFHKLLGKKGASVDEMLMAKFVENAIDIPASGGDHFKGLFLAVGKLNHSPDANARIYWDEKKDQLIVEALRDIWSGQEVTISYCCRRGEFNNMAYPTLEFTCNCHRGHAPPLVVPKGPSSATPAAAVPTEYACLCYRCAWDNDRGIVTLAPKREPAPPKVENFLTEEMMELNIERSRMELASADARTLKPFTGNIPLRTNGKMVMRDDSSFESVFKYDSDQDNEDEDEVEGEEEGKEENEKEGGGDDEGKEKNGEEGDEEEGKEENQQERDNIEGKQENEQEQEQDGDEDEDEDGGVDLANFGAGLIGDLSERGYR